MKIKKVFLVPYCHADWAWTWNRRWHEKRYVLVFDEVLDILKKHPKYRWYFDIYKTELEPFLKQRPERIEELRKRIYEGKIAICGTYTNLRPSMTGEETQVRDILVGREKYKELFPKADLSVYASTVDVSLGHPQMPQVLKKAGYRYYRFGRPPALSIKKIPLEFYWKGQDGSKILCSRGCYCGFNYNENLEENFLQEISQDKDLAPAGIRWLSMGMDDTRPLMTPYEDKGIPIFDFIKKWHCKETSIEFATPVEYFKEIEKERIPEVTGSLDPCEVCYNVGWGGSNGLFRLRQENEVNLTEAEKWTAIASMAGFKKPFTEFDELWEKHLLTCAHATQWLFQKDFDEVMNEALYVKHACIEAKKKALSFLAKNISCGKNAEFIIFNPLYREREEKILLKVAFPVENKSLCLVDCKGKAIPFQVTDTNRNRRGEKIFEYEVMAKVNLPAGGFNCISAYEGKPATKMVKKPAFSAKIKNSEIVEVAANGQKYRAAEENSFGKMRLYTVDTTKGRLHVGPITRIENVRWEKTEKTNDGEILAHYRSQGKIGKHEIERSILIHKDEPLIEIHTQVDWKKQDGFITLEFPRMSGARIYGDFPFGVEEKDMENEPFDILMAERQRKNLFFAKSFINHTDGKKSISYINYDASHYYLLSDNTVGNVLINSVTNLTGWERLVNTTMLAEGRHKFVSHLIFHPGDWKKFNLPAQAERFVRPPEILYVDKVKKGGLPGEFSFFSVSPSNLVTTGFYKQGKDYILRFYEAEGRKTSADIRFFKQVKQAAKTDMENNIIENVTAKGNSIRLDVAPCEIVTLHLRFYDYGIIIDKDTINQGGSTCQKYRKL